MDDKQAKALREPFPASAIGKLPKAGVVLDYVGHAATTDRLLKVDPAWTWEPMALDEHGLPAMDAAGNLWIRLTVAGVTRIGVGDGKTMKERIGDAIRNAAMRFGVALDLWAKEDLMPMGDTETPKPARKPSAGSLSAATSGSADSPPPTRSMGREPAQNGDTPADGVTPAMMKKIAASMNELGMTDRDSALAYVADTIGRPIESRNDLTRSEAHRLIDALEREGVKS